MQEIIERSLTSEQRMMRDAIRSFVDKEVTHLSDILCPTHK